MMPVRTLLLCTALFFHVTSAGARPVVAVLAQNMGTEITDFLGPYGVVAAADAADVIAVSTGEGVIELVPGPFLPGLRIAAGTTIDAFDREHPAGASFVIIPAFRDPRDDVTRSWLRLQAEKGATLVSI